MSTTTERSIITVLGDSLAMPRPGDDIFERDTYPALLQFLLGGTAYVVNRSSVGNYAGRTISQETTVYVVQGTQADIFIVQIGIVDCAPRLFTMEEKEMLSIMGNIYLLDRLVRLWVNSRSRRRVKLTEERPVVRTTAGEFDKYSRTLVNNVRRLTPAKRMLIVNIPSPGNSMVERSHGIEKNVEEFNAILDKVVGSYAPWTRVVDLHAITKVEPSLLLPDGHHLSKAGHKRLAGLLLREFESCGIERI